MTEAQTDTMEVYTSETQTDTVEVYTTEIQTDTVTVCMTAVQTEPCNHESGEQNLLTPLPNSMIISIPLQYYLSVKLESVSQLSNSLRSMKCIKNWFVLSFKLQPESVMSSLLKCARIL